MAAEFELEVKNSITALQAVVEKLAASNDKANNSLRKTQEELRRTTALHRENATAANTHGTSILNNEKAMSGFGKAAGNAGGALGKMVKEGAEFIKFNPIMLAAGVAVGVVAGAVGNLIEQQKAATAAAKEMADAIAGAGGAVGATGDKALGALDVAGARRDAFNAGPDGADPRARAAAKAASLATGIGESEALANIENSGALTQGNGAFSQSGVTADRLTQIGAGKADMDPAEFKSRSTSGGQSRALADIAERQQASTAASAQAQAMQDARVGAGMGTSADRANVALRGDASVKIMADMLAELKRLNDKQAAGGWTTNVEQSRRQDAINAQSTRIVEFQTSISNSVR